MLHLVLCMHGQCTGAGQGGAGRCPSFSLLFLDGSWENAGGSRVSRLHAPCGRALPEVGRQRVAELHGAASDINPLHFLCLADLQSQAPLFSLGIFLTCHTSSWHKLRSFSSPSFSPQSVFLALRALPCTSSIVCQHLSLSVEIRYSLPRLQWGCFPCGGAACLSPNIPLTPALLCWAGWHPHSSGENLSVWPHVIFTCLVFRVVQSHQ